MLETLRNAWKIKEIRNKILFTIFIILVFRVGSVIPVPYIDVEALRNASTDGTTNEFFSYLSILTGGGLEYGAIFAMSVTPYINSSIIIQLLCVAIPALERLSKEGEEGQKKLAQITRYATVILALIQGTAYFIYLNNSGFLSVSGGAVIFGTTGGVIHCYSGSYEMAKEYVKLGYYLGIGGVVTFKNSKVLKKVAAEIPLESIVVETDCPYLAPMPHRGTRNSSAYLPLVIEEIANLRGISTEEVEQVTYENACRLYHIQ